MSVASAVAPQVDARPRVRRSQVFLALLHRDMRVARKELPFFLIRTTLQPLLFIIVFGFLLPKMGFMRGDYTATLLPGILAVSLTFASIQAVALPMVQDFGWTNEIEDRLLAPVPTRLIAAEKIVSGVLGASAFSALGLLLGTAISPQQIGLMFSVIIAPMLFFGCAYYPWSGLSAVPFMKYAVLINPLVYVAEGMRGALIPGVPHMPLPISVAALVVIGVIFWMLGIRSFERRAIG